MDFRVLTIFPDLFVPFWKYGMIRRAIDQGRITAAAIDIRDHADGRHRVTDDRPYGGGSGMVMKPEPLSRAISKAKEQFPEAVTVLLSPRGRVFDQQAARELATVGGLILVCGRYEGVDERICRTSIDLEVSVGDYVLTGGETAAMIVIDAVARLLPGVLGGADSAQKDSFSEDLLEHGHYTRPAEYMGESVPEVLRSGHHGEIENWRREMSLIQTVLKRPDLLENRPLDRRAIQVLKKWGRTIERIVDAQDRGCADPSSGDESKG
ncbi:MAG: tRNA (guanosine(37)-N1)-methyltransferase TrmD [Desulfobacterales bacterium]|nr:tRNA (guanosine(37)-N1)-methyltransferase TrmD [Desulfobacterales bacterium]